MSSKTDKTKDNTPKPSEKFTYTVKTAHWDGPHFKQVGEMVEKTEEEAKYRVPHDLVLKKPDTTPPPPDDKTKPKR